MKTSNVNLDYYLVGTRNPLSLDIEDSDHVGNLLIMHHLVGTLVKYESVGRYRPSVASSWEVNNDQKTWIFRIRDGLQCEDGTAINAESFKQSLIGSLFRYSKKKKPPVFDKLVGWNNFIENSDTQGLGIHSDHLTLTFKFSKPVRGGFLEFLGMPYFGFVCPGNFVNGKWSNPLSIISSGSYLLKEFSENGDVTLIKNPRWFHAENGTPDQVNVKNVASFSDINIEASSKTIIEALPKPEDILPSKFTQVREIPTTLLPIILLPHAGSFFESVETRRYFRTKIEEKKNKISFSSPSYQLSNLFYPTHPRHLREDSALATDNGSPRKPFKKIRVRSYAKPLSTNLVYIERLISEVFSAEGIDVEFDNSPVKKIEDWFGQQYDIRILGADIGGGIENWIVEMMFCSNLGVRYPDPSLRICSLVKKFDNGDISFDEYVQEFNRAIFEDAAVIPIMHGGRSWLLSQDIPTDAISPLMGLPSFDDLKLE